MLADGSDALEPPPAEGEGEEDGRFGDGEPPPPDEPLDGEGDEGDGMAVEEDCWLAHPPINSADTALTLAK